MRTQMIAALVVGILAGLALSAFPARAQSPCPAGTYPTKVSIAIQTWRHPEPWAKAEGVLCGTYALEPIVGPALYEEDFRALLEAKGFTVLEGKRHLKGWR